MLKELEKGLGLGTFNVKSFSASEAIFFGRPGVLQTTLFSSHSPAEPQAVLTFPHFMYQPQ